MTVTLAYALSAGSTARFVAGIILIAVATRILAYVVVRRRGDSPPPWWWLR
ncbi:MAG TPA: hypothetical protein VM143_14645 [Acidimicrobiales bacterium]|nr:hypothetical protein [Acidimicrobiales bacterium]